MNKRMLALTAAITAALNFAPLSLYPAVASANMKVYHESTKEEAVRASKLVSNARENAMAQNFNAAIDLYSQAIFYDNTVGVYAERAWCKYRIGDKEGAELDADTATKHRYSEGGLAEFLLGKICFEKGDYDGAIRYYSVALDEGITAEEIVENIAVCYDSQERYEEAAKYYLILLACNPENEFALNGVEKVRDVLNEKIEAYKYRQENPYYIPPTGEVYDGKSNFRDTRFDNNSYLGKNFNLANAEKDAIYGEMKLAEGRGVSFAWDSAKLLNKDTIKERLNQFVGQFNDTAKQLEPFGQVLGLDIEEIFDGIDEIKTACPDEKIDIGAAMLIKYSPDIKDFFKEKPAKWARGRVTGVVEDEVMKKAPEYVQVFLEKVCKVDKKTAENFGDSINWSWELKKSLEPTEFISKCANLLLELGTTPFELLEVDPMFKKDSGIGKALYWLAGRNKGKKEKEWHGIGWSGIPWMEDYSGKPGTETKIPNHGYSGYLFFHQKGVKGGIEKVLRVDGMTASVIRLDNVSGGELRGGTAIDFFPILDDRIRYNGITRIHTTLVFGEKDDYIEVCYLDGVWRAKIKEPSGMLANGKQAVSRNTRGTGICAEPINVGDHIEVKALSDGIMFTYYDCYGAPAIRFESHNFEKLSSEVYLIDMNADVYMYL